MKKIILTLVFGSLLSISGLSQEARKIDEFGSVQCEDYLARMDNVIVELGNNPSSRIYVFVYEGKTQRYKYRNGEDFTIESVLPQYALAKAKINSMKKLLSVRKVPIENFVLVSGGFRENFTVEFWLVPAGAKQPEPTPTLTKMRYRKGKPYGFCLGCCEP